MKFEIRTFGQITDIVGASQISVECSPDTKSLREELERLFPGISALAFAIAIDKKVSSDDHVLNSFSEIALLPPFSGG